MVDQVANTDITVLIRGESGTGKELVAREICCAFIKKGQAVREGQLCRYSIWSSGKRAIWLSKRAPLLERLSKKPGKFEFANHGTIFLGRD